MRSDKSVVRQFQSLSPQLIGRFECAILKTLNKQARNQQYDDKRYFSHEGIPSTMLQNIKITEM
jgi:hypothetical protein